MTTTLPPSLRCSRRRGSLRDSCRRKLRRANGPCHQTRLEVPALVRALCFLPCNRLRRERVSQRLEALHAPLGRLWTTQAQPLGNPHRAQRTHLVGCTRLQNAAHKERIRVAAVVNAAATKTRLSRKRRAGVALRKRTSRRWPAALLRPAQPLCAIPRGVQRRCCCEEVRGVQARRFTHSRKARTCAQSPAEQTRR